MEHAREPVRPTQLWFGVGFGAFIWALHLVVVYAVQSVSCHWGFLQYNLLGINALRFVLLALTLLAGIGVFTAFWTSYGNYRRLAEEKRREGVDEPEGRFLFMTEGGALLNGLFLLSITFSAVPILFLRPCSPFWW